jgi:hypothetical protein
MVCVPSVMTTTFCLPSQSMMVVTMVASRPDNMRRKEWNGYNVFNCVRQGQLVVVQPMGMR